MSRPRRKCFRRLSDRDSAAFSSILPPELCSKPVCIMPFRKVPVVIMTDVARISVLLAVIMPLTFRPSKSSPWTSSERMRMFGVSLILFCWWSL